MVCLLNFLFYFFLHKVGAATLSIRRLSVDIVHLAMRTQASQGLVVSITKFS